MKMAAAPELTDRIELLGSYWTIAGRAYPHTDREYSPFDFRARVEALAQAGFKGMGIWHADLDHILLHRSLQEMKQILHDNGIIHVELEFLADWFLDGEAKKQSDIRKARLLRASAVLEAHHVKVGDFLQQKTPMDKLIDSFAALCKEAAEYGARIGFELMPFAMIDSLEDTLTMLEGADAGNGGVIFDLWHLVKGGISFEQAAAIPLRFLTAVEINDGYLKTPAGMDLHTETTAHRKFCGEGEFDVKGFVRQIWNAGYRGPIGIEVLSAESREWPLDKIVSHAYATTMAQFENQPPQSP
jgi:sugar phosphate isomerase/epimerase